MRRISTAQRRARLGRRHHLEPAARAGTVAAVAGDLAGLHGTDPASVFLAAQARLPAAAGTAAAIEHALYEERTLVRILGMRRTMFVLPVELAPVVHAGCTRAIAVAERRRLVGQLEAAGIGSRTGGDADAASWLAEVEEATVAALAARGTALATELSADVPALRAQLSFGAGRTWQAQQAVGTRVLFLLAAQGRIMRGRPRGSWTSSQYRWTPAASWLPGGLTGRLAAWPTEAARTELVRRWLAGYGPGTVADLRWWTGWTATEVRRALAGLETAEVALDDGGTALVLAGDHGGDGAGEPDPGSPWAALLPALDPTVMGWAGRDWYLGDHGPALFDRSGNAGPTVWWDGRVVGGWAQRKDGEIAVRLLEDVGAEARTAVEAEAARLAGWLGPVRVTPRFRTPLERELTA